MEDKIFLTIRQVAKTGLLPEHALRQMLKQKNLPHIMAGTKCLVNYPLLVKQLDDDSRRAAGGG